MNIKKEIEEKMLLKTIYNFSKLNSMLTTQEGKKLKERFPELYENIVRFPRRNICSKNI